MAAALKLPKFSNLVKNSSVFGSFRQKVSFFNHNERIIAFVTCGHSVMFYDMTEFVHSPEILTDKPNYSFFASLPIEQWAKFESFQKEVLKKKDHSKFIDFFEKTLMHDLIDYSVKFECEIESAENSVQYHFQTLFSLFERDLELHYGISNTIDIRILCKAIETIESALPYGCENFNVSILRKENDDYGFILFESRNPDFYCKFLVMSKIFPDFPESLKKTFGPKHLPKNTDTE